MSLTDQQETDAKIETSSLQLRIWILGGGGVFLMLLVQILLTYFISSAAGEIKTTNIKIAELATSVQVEAVRNDGTRSQVTKLEADGKVRDTKLEALERRVGSLEARAAVHDAFMTSHK